MKIIILIALLFIGCGKPNSPTNPVVVDPDLVPYFARFSQTIGVSTDGIAGQFATLRSPAVGLCTLYNDSRKVIQIDSDYWSKASDDQKEQLVAHECGHCAMGLQHIPTVNEFNCPVSIMYPQVFGNSHCYVENRDYYFQELRSHK
jgi:hypothetical protein